MKTDEQLIGFVGGGNMAVAMIRGLLGSGHAPAGIAVAEPRAEQREKLAALAPGLQLHADNAGVASQANVLVLAVKPQLMDSVAVELAALDRPASQLVVSIAAGISLARLAGHFGSKAALVRVMPNQPALVGAGVSALVASATVSPEQRVLAGQLATAMGSAHWLDDEAQMDAVTALSGSGPAYYYLLMEIMEECGRELGLPPALARQLTIGTAAGAGRAAAELVQDPAALRSSVTSPGGTTAAAIETLEQGGIRALLQKALRAARDRSIALGQITPAPRD